jgi:hypothetical protein
LYGPGSAKQRFAKSYALHRARDASCNDPRQGSEIRVSGTVAAFCRYQAHQFRFTFNAKRQAFLLD